MTGQLDLFRGLKLDEIEPTTELVVRKKTVRIPLRRRRRQALTRLLQILKELEGKDVWISTYDAGGRHFWIQNLKLQRLSVESFPMKLGDPNWLPSVIVLKGRRNAEVRIFTDYLVAVRKQTYQRCCQYLLDFRNGLWEHRIDQWHSHYACLHLTKPEG